MHLVFLCRESRPAKIQIGIRRQFFIFNGSLIFQPKEAIESFGEILFPASIKDYNLRYVR